jgi:7,8-dihydro-6-hydroxymethylpterin dimethyltransferase
MITVESDDSLSWSETTSGLCPVCLQSVPTTLFEQDGKIWIEKECVKHGAHRALIASDANEYLRLRQYVPPRVSGCCCGPGDVCDTGKPPTCVLLLEITQACNLSCPTCYADAHGHDYMSLDEAKRRLDLFFAQQSALDVLMISGGEPTIHPQFLAILDLALSYPINKVLINTNGLRIAQSAELVTELAKRRKQIELYLSFSSFRADSHIRLYGRDLLKEKLTAFDAAQRASIFVNIVATVEAGVNDDELGDLFAFALTKSNISGLVLQPVMDTGRYRNEYTPTDRTTLTGAIAKLCEQSHGMLVPQDFVGLPCSHPDCAALTYGFLNKDRTSLMPLPRYLDVAQYLDLFADRISFSGLIGTAASRLRTDINIGRGKRAIADLIRLLRQPAVRAMIPLLGNSERVGSRVFRVVVKPFMDAHTYDSRRSDQCCTKVIDASGAAVSFCDYNIFRRGRAQELHKRSLPMIRS